MNDECVLIVDDSGMDVLQETQQQEAMDEFEIESHARTGTTVTARKWLP
jgi:hypothetical protein